MARASIQGMQAEANTVAAFQRVNARFNGRLRITSPYGAGRTHEQQAYLHSLWLQGRGNYAAPAGSSNHEFDVTGGTALDISNWESFPTLRAQMAEEGFTRDAVENWHYNFRGTITAGGGATAIPGSLPTPTEVGEDEMQTILIEITDGEGRYSLPKGSTKGSKYFSLFTPATKAISKLADPALANQLVVEFGRKNGATGEALGSGYNCAYTDWEQFHGGSYDPHKP